mmetsp:Transcript_88811/g.133117  ORF Transcript_88811/g.133117 Transcript_88811/m.133117 type:complete len:331 (-) Transcript_88811:482-1474(-)
MQELTTTEPVAIAQAPATVTVTTAAATTDTTEATGSWRTTVTTITTTPTTPTTATMLTMPTETTETTARTETSTTRKPTKVDKTDTGTTMKTARGMRVKLTNKTRLKCKAMDSGVPTASGMSTTNSTKLRWLSVTMDPCATNASSRTNRSTKRAMTTSAATTTPTALTNTTVKCRHLMCLNSWSAAPTNPRMETNSTSALTVETTISPSLSVSFPTRTAPTTSERQLLSRRFLDTVTMTMIFSRSQGNASLAMEERTHRPQINTITTINTCKTTKNSNKKRRDRAATEMDTTSVPLTPMMRVLLPCALLFTRIALLATSTWKTTSSWLCS